MITLFEHARDNVALYVIVALVVLPVSIYYRRQCAPVLYHFVEYCVYVGCMHILFGGIVRVAGWYKTETSMVALGPDKPFITPLWDQFWIKGLYRPEALFYVELGLAFLLAYVVVVIRPVRMKNRSYNNRPNEKKPKKSVYGDRAVAYRNRQQQARR